MNKSILLTIAALSTSPAFALEPDERLIHSDIEMLKVIDRLTPEQQKRVIDLVEADEFERYAKEFKKIQQKRKNA